MVDRLRPYRLELVCAIVLIFLGTRYVEHEHDQDQRIATIEAEHTILQANQDYLLDAMCRGFRAVNVIVSGDIDEKACGAG